MANTANESEESFTARVIDRTLITSFARPCQVVSWASLHGGFRTSVSHVVMHRLSDSEDVDLCEKLLRQAAGRLGLKGSVVGMATMVDVRRYVLSQRVSAGLRVAAVYVTDCLAQGYSANGDGGRLTLGSGNLLLFVNQHQSHEAMLEAMATCVEVKARSVEQWRAQTARSNVPVVTRTWDCVAVATEEDQQHRYRGNYREVQALISQLCVEDLGPSTRKIAE